MNRLNRVEDFVIKNENLSVALEPDAASVSYQNDPFGSQHPNDPTSLSTSPLLSKNGLANKYTNKLYPTIRHTFRNKYPGWKKRFSCPFKNYIHCSSPGLQDRNDRVSTCMRGLHQYNTFRIMEKRISIQVGKHIHPSHY